MPRREPAKPSKPVGTHPASAAAMKPPMTTVGSSPQSYLAQLLFIGVAALAVYGFVQAAQADQRRASCTALCALAPNYAGKNRLAPDFELPDMDGKMVKLSSFRGKTVILNFWTKTCGPCKDEIPSLGDLAIMLKNKGMDDIVLLTVSTDDGPESVRDTLKVLVDGNDHPFTILFDPDLKVVKEKYGTELFPETWIIDPQGFIRARFDGSRDWSNALGLDVAHMVGGKGPGCLVQFDKARPKGPFGSLCDPE